jgi:hypothetical protein
LADDVWACSKAFGIDVANESGTELVGSVRDGIVNGVVVGSLAESARTFNAFNNSSSKSGYAPFDLLK